MNSGSNMHPVASTYAVVNLGCKVNRVESDGYESMFESAGYQEAPAEDADVVVVNTCTVTGEADKKTRKTVRHILRKNPGGEVIVTGCAAAIHEDVFLSMDPRVRVVGKASMENYLAQRGVCGVVGSASNRVRLGVKVQDGCAHACTYCIVHVARGVPTSTPPERVLAACQTLISQGVPEIVLTGINLGSYSYEGMNLAALLQYLLHALGVANTCDVHKAPAFRFRLSSIEPMDITDELIGVIEQAGPAICHHLHLPLQAGSTKVLKEMNRPYTAEGFIALVQRLRESFPDLSLSTDVIVGFPGETDEDFAETCKVSEECRFSSMHVFPYSMREGTLAAERTDQVDPAVKEARARELREVAKNLSKNDASSREGTLEWAVVEKPGLARTDSYYLVEVDDSVPVASFAQYRFSL